MINTTLDIYRAGSIHANINIDASTVFSDELPGTELISCPIKTPVALDLQEEDYIFWDDVKYVIHILPNFGKSSETLAKSYTITFEAEFYELLDTFVEHEGAHTFPYYGTAADQAQLVLTCANTTSSGYTLGQVDVTEPKTLNYDWTYVRPSLDYIASEFGLEFKFVGKTLNLIARVGRDTNIVMKYGRGQGLHQLTRSVDTSKNVLTRVYGLGGIKNMRSDYRGGLETKGLVFESRFVQTTGAANGTERVKMGKYVNENIFPQFIGTVQSTTVSRDANNNIISATITDPTIDFNLNLQLKPEIKGKLSFLTGSMVDVDFEISSFDYATKTVTIIPNTDQNGYVLPNDLNLPEVGLKFTFYDIIMPMAYETRAENQLEEETTTFMNQNKLQRVLYGAKPDEKQLRDNQIRLRAGDTVHLIDDELGIDEILRFTKISYPLVNRYDVTAVVGNEITYDQVAKLYATVANTTQQVSAIDRRGQEIAKRGAADLRVLAESIFDVEGNFDSLKFNVGVLSALLGIFGLQSANFLLNKVFITANYGGDPNAVNISVGELFHLEYSNPGNQNVWQMQAITQNGLIPGKEYYVYSKLSKTSQVGSFLITTDQVRPEDIPGFYTVRTGLIYPQIDGLRDVDFTYGITTVNGRQIKAGIIQGNTGALIINLDTGEIFGKMTFRASDGTIKDVVTVDNTAALAQANALAAQVLADNANAELADIASDSKLTPNEKVTVSRDLTYINQEYPVRIQEAIPYGVSTADYTTAYNALNAYVNGNGLLINLNATSDIVSADFKNAFANYYAENVRLTKSISDAANHKIDSINVGGRNYFSRTSTLENGGALALQHVNGDINGVSAVTNGIFATGNPNSLSLFRIRGVISKNGDWTVSGYIMSNGDFGMTIDICDNVPAKDIAVTSSGFTYFEVTVNVQNHSDAVYNFVDFNNLPYVYLYIKDLKIEQGSKATDWTEAPEDLQADLETAKAQSAQAIAELAAIADDGILDVSEKVGALKDFRAIAANIDSREHQALTYGLSIADIDSKYHALVDYVTPLFNNMSINSPIDRDEFINKFNDYYRAEQALLQGVTDAANGRIQAKSYSSGKMLYTDPEFSGSYGQNGYNGIAAYNNAGNGTVSIGRGVNYSDFASGGLPANPNSTGCYIAIAYNGGVASPGLGGFFFGNQTRANAVFITRVVAMIPVGYVIQWQSNQFGEGGHVEWLTSQAGSGKWEEYIVRVTCGSTGTFSTTNFFNLEGAGAVNWYLSYATVFDMSAAPTDPLKYADVQTQAAITQANAYAASIAQSKADAAQAAALSQASSDAQAKADAAYNASVVASNAYANTVSNSAASSVQIAAAADASNKANAAYSNAQAAADARYNALTGQLGNMAFRSVQAAAGYGITTVDNGSVITFLVDAAYIRSNVIDVGYITGLNLNFVQGSIGGILINGSGIYSGNGTFYINNAGQLYCTQATVSGTINATSGYVGGFTIGSNRLYAGAENTLNQGYVNITPGAFLYSKTGASTDDYQAISFLGTYTGGDRYSSFVSNSKSWDEANTALILSASGSSFRNYALRIISGDIVIRGNLGFTGYELVSSSGTQTRKYVSGIYVGQGNGNNW